MVTEWLLSKHAISHEFARSRGLLPLVTQYPGIGIVVNHDNHVRAFRKRAMHHAAVLFLLFQRHGVRWERIKCGKVANSSLFAAFRYYAVVAPGPLMDTLPAGKSLRFYAKQNAKFIAYYRAYFVRFD